jgi:hypothetical protein
MDTPNGTTTRSIRALFTRARANDGVRVEVKGDNDKPTGDWVLVRGVDSDVVQAALLGFSRSVAEDAGDGSDAVKKDAKERQPFSDPKVVSSMVANWSFAEPCTPDVLGEALVEAPYLRPLIVNASLKRASFLPPAAPDSLPQQSITSG